MIDKIILFSVKNKLVIGMMVLSFIVSGIYSMFKLPLDAVPDITNNQVQLITTSPNLATEDMEQFVSYPVELAMANLPGVEEIRSVSRFGLSVVTVVFKDDMGTYLPRQLVAEQLAAVAEDIPEGFGRPEMGPISTGLGEIYQYVLKCEEGYKGQYDAMELRSMQDWIVKRQLAMIPGVVEVNSFGGRVKEYEIAIMPGRLKSMGVSITELFEALENNNQNTGGAYIEKNHRAYFIRGEGLARSIEDIELIPVKRNGALPVLIKDLAEVRYGSAVRYGAFTQNGEGESVGGIIMMLKGANSNEVVSAVQERVESIQNSLPEGVRIHSFLDRSSLIERTSTTLATNLLEGGLIVIFVLILLLGNFRGGLIVASTIPLSLLFAFIMMHIFGVSANLMSLGAIDFGIIVDGAVIIVESMVFYLSRKWVLKKGQAVQEAMDEVAVKSSGSMMSSAFFGQFIILIVFLPILSLTGIEGKMFRPMALTFGFAMIGAMILCLTYVPMISALFLRKSKTEKPSAGARFVNRLETAYRPYLEAALEKKKWLIGTATALLALSIFLFARMGGEFIPQLDEGNIAFHAVLKPGSSLSETTAATTRIEKMVLDNFPEVKDILSRIGVAEVPTDPMPMDLADIFVILKDKKYWRPGMDKDRLLDEMKASLMDIPGINYEFTQPIEMRFNELLTGVREDIAVKLYGEDMDVLAAKADEIATVVNTIEGAADMRVEAIKGLPQITVNYRRDKMAQYGIDIKTLNNVLRTAFSGEKAGVIFEGEKRFDMVVRLAPSYREDIQDVSKLYVTLQDGSQLPMSELADISLQPGPMQISRDNTNRRITVGVNLRGRDTESFVNELSSKVEAKVDLPPGYYIKYGGAFENLERAKSRLSFVVPVALLLIFVLLYFALKSLKQSMMIFMAIPLAAIGGVLSLYLRDMPFSISAGIGFIVLFGVAVLNGLVLVSSYNELKAEGITDIKERILKGTTRRIRPILLTASTDMLGFLPMAISSSAGAEVQRPLATVVIGGLFTATLLTLFIVPIFYYIIEKRAAMKLKKIPATLALVALFFAIDNKIYASESDSLEIHSLEQVLSFAKDRLPELKQAALLVEKEAALQGNRWQLGRTTIYTAGEELKNGEDGVRTVGISQQNIKLFGTKARSDWYASRKSLMESNQKLTEQLLIQQLTALYYTIEFVEQRKKLLDEIAVSYKNFERVARLRFETGESNQLEYLTAKSRYAKLKLEKDQAAANSAQLLFEMAQWLMVDSIHWKANDFDTLDLSASLSYTGQNLYKAYYANKLLSEKEKLYVAKSALMPSFNLNYGRQELAGETGFYTFQAGISIPLFYKPQQAKIRAAKIDVQIAAEEQEKQSRNWENNWAKKMTALKSSRKELLFYKNEALPMVLELERTAARAYQEGEIDYLNYLKSLEESREMRENYLNALLNYSVYLSEVQLLNGTQKL